MICGNCKSNHTTVQEVKDCFAGHGTVMTKAPEVEGFAKQYIESRDFKPMATSPEPLPASSYALETANGLAFYEVQNGKGKWKGTQFLVKLIGHPGTWKKIPVKGSARSIVMAQLQEDPKAAAILFSRNFTICAVCGSPLSDPESLAAGLGPVCATRF